MIDNDTLVEEQVQQSSQEQSEETTQQAAQPAEDKSAINMRRLREKSERMERERDELARRVQEMESRNTQQQQEEEDFQIEPDALAEGKHLKKVMQKIKRLEDENRKHRQQSTVDMTEARLKMQYPDFDKVVSKESIESLRQSYPEIAESIHSNPDIYKRAVSAYTIIQKMGLYEDPDKFSEEKAVVQKNAAKPKPMASLSPQQGDSPLSRANAFANGLTKELQAQLLKEMMDVRKGH